MSYPYHRDRGRDRDRDRDSRGSAENGRGNSNYRQQHRRSYHSPPAPEYSHASPPGGYSTEGRLVVEERGKSRDRRGVYGRGGDRGYDQQDYTRRRGERDWDKPTTDLYSDRDWDREDEEHDDPDVGRSTSSRGRSVSKGAGYRDRDRPRSLSQSCSRSNSHSRDYNYRDRERHWDRGDRGDRDRGERDRDRDRDRERERDGDRSPFYGAAPCRDVIFEGFGFEISEDDVCTPLPLPPPHFFPLPFPLSEKTHHIALEQRGDTSNTSTGLFFSTHMDMLLLLKEYIFCGT